MFLFSHLPLSMNYLCNQSGPLAGYNSLPESVSHILIMITHNPGRRRKPTHVPRVQLGSQQRLLRKVRFPGSARHLPPARICPGSFVHHGSRAMRRIRAVAPATLYLSGVDGLVEPESEPDGGFERGKEETTLWNQAAGGWLLKIGGGRMNGGGYGVMT